MKRFFSLVLSACLLLTTGCALTGSPVAPTAPTDETTVSTTAQTKAITTTIAPTTPPTGTVTVYLLDEATIFDTGRTVYHYDDEGNIVSLESLTLEDDLICSQSFEEPDENGMPCKVTLKYPDDDGSSYSYTLTYFDDGRIHTFRVDNYDSDDRFTGYKYNYDPKGNLIAVEEYYEDDLYSRRTYEYDGETLTDVYCKDAEGSLLYSGDVENGRVVGEYDYQDGVTVPYACQYDEHGNLIEKAVSVDFIPYFGTFYSYKPIEVPADRAFFLQQQQLYLLSHT